MSLKRRSSIWETSKKHGIRRVQICLGLMHPITHGRRASTISISIIIKLVTVVTAILKVHSNLHQPHLHRPHVILIPRAGARLLSLMRHFNAYMMKWAETLATDTAR